MGKISFFLAIATSVSLFEQGAAFGLPGWKANQEMASGKVFAAANTNRRTFFQSAAAVAAASLLSPTKANAFEVGGKMVLGDESIMSQKEHGTSSKPVQGDLLYGVPNKLADKICTQNRHFAENGGSFRSTSFEDVVFASNGPITFYDSVTGKPLFVAPINRSAENFVEESEIHGWPSFRDEEVSYMKRCACRS
jgi:hypothetical protein